MRRRAYWPFALIAGGVAVFIVVFLIKINPSSPRPDAVENGENEKGLSDRSDESGASWLDRFSIKNDTGTLYPLNEVSLELDFGNSDPSVQRYRLSVPLKNSTELFRLKQELKNSGFTYFFQKEGDAMTLLVDSDDQNKLASLVTKLKTYQISATVSPYTEEK
ncbi:MAG: hypothetical protein AB7S65_03335 [Sulfuricurvum sp.]